MISPSSKLVLVTLAIKGSLTIDELIDILLEKQSLINEEQIRYALLQQISAGRIHVFYSGDNCYYRLRMLWE